MSRISELLNSDNPIFNSSRTIPLPPLPPDDTPPSPLYQLIQRQNNYPPILMAQSWTRSAPYKEQKEHRTPVESIANNYTPPSSNLKIRQLSSTATNSTQPQTARPGCLPPPALPGFHERQVAKSADRGAGKRKRMGNGVSRKEAKLRESSTSSPEDESLSSPSEQFSM